MSRYGYFHFFLILYIGSSSLYFHRCHWLFFGQFHANNMLYTTLISFICHSFNGKIQHEERNNSARRKVHRFISPTAETNGDTGIKPHSVQKSFSSLVKKTTFPSSVWLKSLYICISADEGQQTLADPLLLSWWICNGQCYGRWGLTKTQSKYFIALVLCCCSTDFCCHYFIVRGSKIHISATDDIFIFKGTKRRINILFLSLESYQGIKLFSAAGLCFALKSHQCQGTGFSDAESQTTASRSSCGGAFSSLPFPHT